MVLEGISFMKGQREQIKGDSYSLARESFFL